MIDVYEHPKTEAQSDSFSHENSEEFSRTILLALSKLYDSYPAKVDLTSTGALKKEEYESLRLWQWLKNQEIVTGIIEDASLTQNGYTSIKDVRGFNGITAKLRSNKSEKFEGSTASQMILRIIRIHFHKFING